MRYFSKVGNVKTKRTRVYADMTRGVCPPQEYVKNSVWNMINFSADQYPWFTLRKPIKEIHFPTNCKSGLGAYNSKFYHVEEGEFYYDGKNKFKVSAGKKKFYNYNEKILVFPDMIYYDPQTDEHGKFGITTPEITYRISRRVTAGGDFGLSCIQGDNINLTDFFKVGDGVKITDQEGLGISGFHTVTAVNKETGELYFDRFEFGDGDGFTLKGKLSNGAPERCDAACICGGRVWIAGGNKIHATTINDERNWAVGGDDEKSSFVCEFDKNETVTACVEFEGSPVFFTKNKIYKVYGDRASNFYLKCCSNWGGIPQHMSDTVAVFKDRIFYVSNHCVTCFDGSTPRILMKIPSEIDGDMFAASDGQKYYVFVDNGERLLYVYDDISDRWHIYGWYEIKNFFSYNGDLYAYARDKLCSLSGGDELLGQNYTEPIFDFSASFMFETRGKRPVTLGLDIECDFGTKCSIYVSYKTINNRTRVKSISGYYSGLVEIPLVPGDCENVWVYIDGSDSFTLKQLYVDFVE